MRYGYWLPVFGGWLRNVEDEQMAATGTYVNRLARRSEQIGFDLTLVAELNLNDIKGVDAPGARRLVHGGRSGRRDRAAGTDGRGAADVPPSRPARQAGRQHRPHRRRRVLSLNVVSSWWKDEARKYGVAFRAARRPLCAHLGMARRGGRRLARDHFRSRGQVLSRREHCVAAEAGHEAPADHLRRRRIGSGQEPDRAESATPT